MNMLKFWIAFIRAPFVMHLDALFGGGAPAAPAPDPNIGVAAQQNAEVAREALAFNKQVYEENKPRQAASDVIAAQVVNDQLAISKQNQTQAAGQWDRFKALFAPVEAQTVADATNIDTAANQEIAAGDAGAQVAKSYDSAQKQTARNLASMGINPNSGKALATTATLDMSKAADTASAMTNARQLVKDKGITLRAGVANFGRNMPNTAANSYGIAMTGGNNAVGNQNSTMATSNANAAQMNSGFNTSINGNSSAMQGLNAQYGNQLSGYNAQQQANATSSAGMGQMVGAIGAALPWATMLSSKKLKEAKSRINDAATLRKVKGLPVENWRYKKGIADESEHVGAYAEDVQAKFGDKAAPGGKMIDMISMHGITLSAVKGLAKQVDKLDSKVEKLSAKRGMKGA